VFQKPPQNHILTVVAHFEKHLETLPFNLNSFLFFKPVQRTGKWFRCQFDKVAGLKSKSPVTANGLKIGQVEEVEVSKLTDLHINTVTKIKKLGLKTY